MNKKEIDLNKSIFELSNEYPELIDIKMVTDRLSELGFTV